MDQPCYYDIRVKGHLAEHWSGWFEGLAVQAQPDGETTLSGVLNDQAAMLGVLSKIHGLNLIIISINRLVTEQKNRG